jgi:hypothetical protein
MFKYWNKKIQQKQNNNEYVRVSWILEYCNNCILIIQEQQQ